MSSADSAPQGVGSKWEVFTWALIDWANSAYSTLSITVLLFYVSDVVFAGKAGVLAYGYVISVTTLTAALLSPVLGAIADRNCTKRFWLALTTLVGASGSLGMAIFPPENTWLVLGLYLIANLGYELSYGFYNSFLPLIADDSSMNRVSAWGFGLGYIGGGLALLIVMLMFQFGDNLGLPHGRSDDAALTADYHEGTNATFTIEVPNGEYLVTTTLGDPAQARDAMVVEIGELQSPVVDTKRGEFVDQPLAATVVNGRLTIHLIDQGGATSAFAVNGLRIAPKDEVDPALVAPLVLDFGTPGSSALPGSLWVVPTDRFPQTGESIQNTARWKPPADASATDQLPAGWSKHFDPQLKFGWSEGTVTSRDAVMPLRLRIGLALMGLWWGLFSLPGLLVLRDRGTRPAEATSLSATAAAGFRRVFATLSSVRRYPTLFLFLIAFLIFNDGVQTIITQAGQFASKVLHIGPGDLTKVVLMIQFVAFPGAIIVGWLAQRFGSKRALVGCLLVYTAWLGAAFFIETLSMFWAMGAVLALIMGGTQSVSRAIMGMLTPPSRSGEFMGFFNLSGKATSAIGPFVFASILALSSSPHLAILSLLVFFVVGLALLLPVNVAKGQREADESSTAPA